MFVFYTKGNIWSQRLLVCTELIYAQAEVTAPAESPMTMGIRLEWGEKCAMLQLVLIDQLASDGAHFWYPMLICSLASVCHLTNCIRKFNILILCVIVPQFTSLMEPPQGIHDKLHDDTDESPEKRQWKQVRNINYLYKIKKSAPYLIFQN